MNTDAVILAGGFGTRLQAVVKDVPKPMADINGRPFLHYLFSYLKRFEIPRYILSVGYKADSIKNYFGSRFDQVPVDYSFESEPLGTGGAIVRAVSSAITEHVLVLNGDTFFAADLDALYEQHIQSGADVTMCLRKVDDAERFGTIEMNTRKRVVAFREKRGLHGPGMINAGVYLFRKDVFIQFSLPEKFSIEKDFFERFCASLEIYGYPSDAYFIDIGIPEELDRARKEFAGMSACFGSYPAG